MPKPPVPTLRRARMSDLDAIVALETVCFEPYRRASRASLRRSLAANDAKGGRQAVFVIDSRDGPGLAALLVLWRHAKTMRIYDVATHPDARGQGLGSLLMRHAEAEARRGGQTVLSLEAEQADPRLVGWYESQGFRQVARIKDYYHQGCHALRLVRSLE